MGVRATASDEDGVRDDKRQEPPCTRVNTPFDRFRISLSTFSGEFQDCAGICVESGVVRVRLQ